MNTSNNMFESGFKNVEQASNMGNPLTGGGKNFFIKKKK
jgi:hypothetical protein